VTLTVRFIEVTSLDLKTVKDWSNQTDPLKKTGLVFIQLNSPAYKVNWGAPYLAYAVLIWSAPRFSAFDVL